jgi:hypothetical protein
MDSVATIALIAGAILLLGVLALLARWQIEAWRRRRARLLHGTAGLHVVAAEEQREEAIAAERAAISNEQAERAEHRREEAERELEEASKEAERARALDPDLETEPDPNAPRLP